MIQRIQSFYLVLAVCALALCFMFPVATCEVTPLPDDATLTAAQNGAQISAKLYLVQRADAGVNIQVGDQLLTAPQNKLVATWPLIVTAAIAALLALVSIFMFGNRMRQVRVVACAFLFNVAFLFIVFIGTVDHFMDNVNQLASANGLQVSATFSVATWSSVVSLLFLFLAQRAIRRDEAKVRAADRLR